MVALGMTIQKAHHATVVSFFGEGLSVSTVPRLVRGGCANDYLPLLDDVNVLCPGAGSVAWIDTWGVLDPLALPKFVEHHAFDGAAVKEDVVAATIRRDEAITFVFANGFDRSLSQAANPS